MKRLVLLFAGLILSINALAYNDDPEARQDATKNMFKEVKIVWLYVDDVQKACNAESRKRGNQGFNYQLQACSFWNYPGHGGETCTIVTRKSTSMHTLGHEVLHCFQGEWHKE